MNISSLYFNFGFFFAETFSHTLPLKPTNSKDRNEKIKYSTHSLMIQRVKRKGKKSRSFLHMVKENKNDMCLQHAMSISRSYEDFHCKKT